MKNFSINFKIILLFVGLFAVKTYSSAQSSITFDASQLFSKFSFTDSTGTKLNTEYSGIYTGAYGLGYKYTTDFGLLGKANISMRKAGATMVYDNMNYSWDLRYADIRLGTGYIYDAGDLKPYVSVSGYYAFLLTANQTLNNENFDIKESGSISKNDFGLFISPGVQMEINDKMSLYSEFNYMMGLKNLEPTESKQKSLNKSFGLTIGISVSL